MTDSAGRRPWTDDRIVDYEELMTPLRAAWDRLRAGGPALYDGYEPPSPTSPPIADSLTEKWLDYHRERGRDALDMLLHAAFRLGMEQGVRVWRHDKSASAIVTDGAQALAATLQDCAETLRDRAAMADNGDGVLAGCALACEQAAEIVAASLIFPRGLEAARPEGT